MWARRMQLVYAKQNGLTPPMLAYRKQLGQLPGWGWDDTLAAKLTLTPQPCDVCPASHCCRTLKHDANTHSWAAICECGYKTRDYAPSSDEVAHFERGALMEAALSSGSAGPDADGLPAQASAWHYQLAKNQAEDAGQEAQHMLDHAMRFYGDYIFKTVHDEIMSAGLVTAPMKAQQAPATVVAPVGTPGHAVGSVGGESGPGPTPIPAVVAEPAADAPVHILPQHSQVQLVPSQDSIVATPPSHREGVRYSPYVRGSDRPS